MTGAPPLDGRRYLVDTCALVKLRHADRAVQAEFQAAIANRQLAVCQIVQLEMLRGAEARDFAARRASLDLFEYVPTTEAACGRAVEIQEAIARSRPDGLHRRFPPTDLVIAATAEEHQLGVLHYDSDYDELEPYTHFESRWLAPRGSLP